VRFFEASISIIQQTLVKAVSPDRSSIARAAVRST
jgi:hypothetical protein